jgi:hypothetical protein
MTTESLTYAEIGERLGITPEAARKKVKGLRLPTALGNDGKIRVSVDFDDIRHTPKPARTPPGERPESTRIIPLVEMQKLIDDLRAEIGRRAEDAAIVEELRIQKAQLEAEASGLRELVQSERRRADEAIATRDDIAADRDFWRTMAQRSWWKRIAG